MTDFLRHINTDRLQINIVDQSSLASFKVPRGCTLVNIRFAAIDQRRQSANWQKRQGCTLVSQPADSTNSCVQLSQRVQSADVTQDGKNIHSDV